MLRGAGFFIIALCCSVLVRGGEPGSAPTPAAAPVPLSAAAVLPPGWLDEPPKTETGPVVVTDGILELRGRINTAMRERLEQAVEGGNLTTIRITSHGGEIFDALRMGAMIQGRNIDVVVRDLCLGACAHYIFVAGRHRRLEKNSLVGFMVTLKSGGMVLAKAMETLAVENPAASAMDGLASAEEELYRRRGVAAALLVDPHLAMQPKCVIMRRQGSSLSWNMPTNYYMWVPSRQYLKAAGVEFEGDWPKSHFNLGGLSGRHLKTGVSKVIRYDDDDHLRSRKQRPYRLEDLTQCVLDELPEEPAP